MAKRAASKSKATGRKRNAKPAQRPVITDETPRYHASNKYLSLVRAFPLRGLETPEDYVQARDVFERLASRRNDDRATTDYLDVLECLIRRYERRNAPASDAEERAEPVDQIVRRKLQQRGMSVSGMAVKIGIPQPNLSQMLTGRRSWSRDAIKTLSRLLKIRPERFLE